MRANSIDLASLLRFDQARGEIWLKDYRMVLTSACALGALRRELIETLGWQRARGVLKRFGHAAGLADGHALASRFPQASRTDQLEFGPALHGLEGVANVVRIPDRTRIDLAKGIMHVEAYWENSYEAEQHVELFGRSDVPVCWTLVGYATGHSSAAAEDRTVVVETECAAMGHARCRFVVDYAREMPEAASREEPDYEREHLPAVLQGLLDRVKNQTRSLKDRERRISSLEHELAQYRAPCAVIGDSVVFKDVLTTARKVAPVDATVLLLGESGTGKEVMARVIHDESLRRNGPFLAVNCSALPESLQEAELFGYAKGAFTGASAATPGVFEAAQGGTLFLDEIGDLAPTAQTKILRALQEREVKRIGETRTRKINVRIVAATNRDLRRMIEQGEFRGDLFYRLSVISLTVPPLRDRGMDKILLAEHFLAVYAGEFDRPVRTMSRAARAAILGYRWPGNVRELQHAVQRAVIMASGSEADLEDFPEELGHGSGVPDGPVASGERALVSQGTGALIGLDERERILEAMELVQGNRELAAELLSMSRTTLWRRMKKLGLLE